MTPTMCLAIALFFEARDQPYDGMLMVGEVIKERVESSRYPDDICSVVNQPDQFSYTTDGLSDNPFVYDTYYDRLAWEKVGQAVSELREGPTEFAIGATHYHAIYVDPYWNDSMTYLGKIGDHVFYAEE